MLKTKDTTAEPSIRETSVLPPADGRTRFAYLDGIRGLAALYVLLFHVIANGDERLSTENYLLNFFRFGHEAVVIFIVLSGFLLTLPLARASQLQMPNGLGGFFKRRARRILPAYYASLMLLPLFYTIVDILKHATGEGTNWARLQQIYLSADMVSHLLLVHNLSPVWATSANLNPVLWSMATEWWIYFVFALLLLPVWRRAGLWTAVGISIILGLIPWVVDSLGWPSLAAFPHLLGGFGLGMASAALLYSPQFNSRFNMWKTSLIVVAVAAFIGFCFISIAKPPLRLDLYTRWVTDLLLAVTCAAFILLTAHAAINPQAQNGLSNISIRFFGSRPLTFLGEFSYSLYLTHLMVWAIFGITLGLAPIQRVINFSLEPMPVRILVLIPVQLIFAYGFYLLFEKPFLPHRK